MCVCVPDKRYISWLHDGVGLVGGGGSGVAGVVDKSRALVHSRVPFVVSLSLSPPQRNYRGCRVVRYHANTPCPVSVGQKRRGRPCMSMVWRGAILRVGDTLSSSFRILLDPDHTRTSSSATSRSMDLQHRKNRIKPPFFLSLKLVSLHCRSCLLSLFCLSVCLSVSLFSVALL